MQRKKNIRLLVLFVALVMVNAAVILLDENQSGQSVDRYKFTLIDTSQVNKITLKQPGGVITFEKLGGGWQVNQQYPMEERMAGLIFAVMTSVETSRPAGTADSELSERLSEEGILVEFYSDEQVISAFYSGGNSTKTQSYMMRASESIPYVVYIPGYATYLAGLFELKAGDWRNKKVFETSWSSLKSLKIRSEKKGEVQLDIRYRNNFFEVANVSKTDTASMINYLETTAGLMVDQYIEPGEFANYDSLAATSPEYTLLLENADVSKNSQLQIFPALPGDTQRLGKLLPSRQLFTIRQSKVDNIIAVSSDFEQID